MRILVLGGTGQLGRLILQRLSSDFPETVLAGTSRQLPRTTAPDFAAKMIAFDPFRDDWSSLGQADVLVNAIGIIRESPEMSFEKVHQGLTALILKNRALIGNPKIIQLSALGAALNSVSTFLKTKALADDQLLRHENTVVIRPSIVCTPGTMLVQKLRMAGKLSRFSFGLLPFPAEALPTIIRPISGEDLAELITTICRNNNHPNIIEAVGPEEISFGQLLQVVPGIKQVLPVPQGLFSTFAPLLATVFPALLEKEQLQLMNLDNTAAPDVTAAILGRPPASTWEFWKRELALGKSS